MGETLLFCLVFSSQVLLISWFYPRRVIGRGRYVLRNFPPSTHPKLYPYAPEELERWLRNIARLNLVIVVAGLSIVAALILGVLGGEWAGRIVVPFFVVQFVVALAYMNFSGRKFLLAMAKTPPPRVRTTELRRRRLVDFVSPTMLVVAALTNIAFIAFVLYDYWRFGLPAYKTVASIASVVFVLLVFSVTVGIALRAPRVDPYQAEQDRHDVMKLVVQQALAFCSVYPVLFAAWLIVQIFDPDLLEPIIASVFCQGIALASLWPSYRYRVDKVDFDVYRQDARVP